MYLSLLNAALITDLIIILLLIYGYLPTATLKTWYTQFGLAALLADVLSLVLFFLIAQFIYPFLFNKYNLLYFLVVIVGVQTTHDLLFGLFLDQYKGKSEILNLFKNYKNELGYRILIADSLMTISTALLYKFLPYNNIVLTIVLLYLSPYILYSVNI
jgi:hypothetical protein